MKVWIRTDAEATGKEFCEWGPTRMDDLVQAIQYAGGVYDADTDMVQDISYQFIYDARGAGAEIILHVSDAE